MTPSPSMREAFRYAYREPLGECGCGCDDLIAAIEREGVLHVDMGAWYAMGHGNPLPHWEVRFDPTPTVSEMTDQPIMEAA